MKKHYTLLIAIILSIGFGPKLNAQISQGGQPISFTKTNVSNEVPFVQMPEVDVEMLLAEDEANQGKAQPYRFGKNLTVEYSLDNSGHWENLKKGRLWRLGISSPGAFSINFIFDDFYMPEGAKFFIYSEDKSYVLGAFTSENNRADRNFATDVVKGDRVILEYYEPNTVQGQGHIQLETVTHGYKDIFGFFANEAAGGGSGACNNDVNCPGWETWQDDKRSVAIILVGGSGACTGAMVNDVPESGTPYFLTANHCLGGNVGNWVFRFNYENIVCDVNGTPTAQSTSGATLRASNGGSDFALLELNSTPPASHNVYYAGWSRSTTPSTESTAIHHPSGDVKKISRDNDALTTSTFGGAQTWRVGQWEDGTTEPGSSGSPIFDQNHRIVGQLYGGSASCSSITSDYYGRFDVSWDGSSASSRLRDWLDPNNVGPTTVDGYDPNAIVYTTDAKLSSVNEPVDGSIICAGSVTPEIVIQNNGTDDLTSLDIDYSIDGSPYPTINWTGNLTTSQTETVTFPAINLSPATYDFEVYLSNPNGTADQNTDNDTADASFTIVAGGGELTLTITTDDYGDETTWELVDDNNNVLYSGGPYGDNETNSHDLCLSNNECYTFTIFDDFGDGICCDWGNGSYTLETSDGTVIVSGGNFGDEEITDFCLPITTDPPNVNFTSSTQEICEGMTVNFTNQTSSSTSATYDWTFPGGQPSSSTAPNPTVTYITSGTYDVTLEATNQYGTSDLTFQDYIVVNDAPQVSVSTTIDNVGTPPNGTATVNVNGGTAPITYTWSNGAGNVSSIDGLSAGSYWVVVEDANGCSVQETFNISSDVSINEHNLAQLVSLFPNPTNGVITVELPANYSAESVKLFNVIGELIIAKSIQDNQAQLRLDLSDMSHGVYFLQLNFGQQMVTKKIILTKP